MYAGKLFVHAGFQNGVKLSEQHPWGMMTMRSLLSDGRISPRYDRDNTYIRKHKIITPDENIIFNYDIHTYIHIHAYVQYINTYIHVEP